MLPLEGITIVSMEQAVAAPLASRNLADLGARVIKVERVDGGDLARGYDEVVEGTGAHFVWLNRGKESAAFDVKDPHGRLAMRRLIDKSDVFIQNLAPGAASRLGLDAQTLRSGHPGLIVVDISGYGAGGLYESRKAYDMLIQAECGLISVTGTPDQMAKTGIPTADIATGVAASQAILAALLRRSRTGLGSAIEISMLEAAIEWMGHPLYTQMYSGRQPPRLGLAHTSAVPYDAYPTLDGEILIGVQNDGGWRTLVSEVFNLPEAAGDPRFSTNMQRVAHRAECDAFVALQTRKWTTEALNERLAEVGVAAAQVKGMGAVAEHPQLKARGRWRTIRTQNAEVRALLPPATFDDIEQRMGDVPALGQHTRSVLLEAGLDNATMEAMFKSGAALQWSA
jgi:crotonobetainyl-CoA:carnitine CoA-transferase CaiB-like acyl-CoA transferase